MSFFKTFTFVCIVSAFRAGFNQTNWKQHLSSRHKMWEADAMFSMKLYVFKLKLSLQEVLHSLFKKIDNCKFAIC